MREIIKKIFVFAFLLSVISISAQKVEVISKFETKANLYSSPVVTQNGIVVFGGHDKNVYFFNSEGTLINKYKTNGWIHASPQVLSDNTVVIGCYDKNIYRFTEKGELLGNITPGGRIFSKVLEVSDDIFVFGSNKLGVAFYNTKTGIINTFKTKRLAHTDLTLLSSGNIVTGAIDKFIYIIDKNAQEIAKFKTKAWNLHSKPTEL